MIEANRPTGQLVFRLALAEHQRAALGSDLHPAARPELAFQYPLRERIFDLLLDGALQGSRAVHRVEAGFAEQVARSVVQHQIDVALRQAAAQVAELDVHDGTQLLAGERMEYDDVVDTVDEFGAE